MGCCGLGPLITLHFSSWIGISWCGFPTLSCFWNDQGLLNFHCRHRERPLLGKSLNKPRQRWVHGATRTYGSLNLSRHERGRIGAKRRFWSINKTLIGVYNDALISNHHLQVAHQGGTFSTNARKATKLRFAVEGEVCLPLLPCIVHIFHMSSRISAS